MQDQTPIRPSLAATRQAAELGCEMAGEDRSIRPDLDNAYRYTDYHEFRDANRDRWEHSEQFVRIWQERLFKLAEKEGNLLGMRLDDLMSSWDKWYAEIVIPLQSVLWAGWEHSYDLPRRYVHATHACVTEAASCPVLQAAQIHAWDMAKLWGLPAEPTSEAAPLRQSGAEEDPGEAGYAATGDCSACGRYIPPGGRRRSGSFRASDGFGACGAIGIEDIP